MNSEIFLQKKKKKTEKKNTQIQKNEMFLQRNK